MKKFFTQVDANPEIKSKLVDHKEIREDFIPTLPRSKIIL